VQMTTILAPRRWAARNASVMVGGTGVPGGCQPGWHRTASCPVSLNGVVISRNRVVRASVSANLASMSAVTDEFCVDPWSIRLDTPTAVGLCWGRSSAGGSRWRL
jgi:hypothetical protein